MLRSDFGDPPISLVSVISSHPSAGQLVIKTIIPESSRRRRVSIDRSVMFVVLRPDPKKATDRAIEWFENGACFVDDMGGWTTALLDAAQHSFSRYHPFTIVNEWLPRNGDS